MRRPGPNLDQTWTGPPRPGLRWSRSRSRFSGPDLEVRVHGPQNLAGPDPDLTADSVDPTADPKPSAANIAERNKEIADWDKENDKALGLIQMKRTINLSTYDKLTSCSTWNKLKKAFATPTATAVFNDFQKLLAIKVSGNKHPGPEMDEMWTLIMAILMNNRRGERSQSASLRDYRFSGRD